jgi:hypothetical protein
MISQFISRSERKGAAMQRFFFCECRERLLNSEKKVQECDATAA